MRFLDVAFAAPDDLGAFYGGHLGLPLENGTVRVGETALRFEPAEGSPFYHVAFLVPGDRFDAALTWARERVEVLGDEIFESDEWDSTAFYFHDPAGNILELIAHHGLGESGRAGEFAAEELLGLSEVGLVGDRRELFGALESLGLELFRGTLDEPDRLAFVGERGRVLILAPPGRGWLPQGRPAERHPVTATIEAPRRGTVELADGPYRVTAA
jgi:catechol 2,3-dioxygenase-like lactoylglutathione lyase family enzyme